MQRVTFLSTSLLATVLILVTPAWSRQLTFEDRVRAQESIDRVHYRHLIGASRPFETAVPRAALERKVRTYLQESLALERFWGVTITPGRLQDEAFRMAAHTRMPERLREMHGALGNDPFVIQECLARPALVARLAREAFARDASIHAEPRGRAERLRAHVVDGALKPPAGVAEKLEVEFVVDDRPSPGTEPESDLALVPKVSGRHRFALERHDFQKRVESFGGRIGSAGPLIETRGAFGFSILADQQPDSLRSVHYVVRKRTWAEWWQEVEADLDPAAVRAVASEKAPLPSPAVAAACVPDTWTPTTLENAPSARQWHTAVWTGAHMIVWGGVEIQFDLWYYQDTGGRYDPATDTWTLTTTADAPTPRYGHTAVWTGNRMVVWGGESWTEPFYENTGGRYDPMNDSWVPTSVLDAPIGRIFHTAVWTGDRMIVWGGAADWTVGSTGGVYDPAMDSWTPTSTLDAPSDRWFHTAVWTGGTLIVWGGRVDPNTLVSVNTGGRYDLSTNSWTPTSVVDAPSPRFDHGAVWTGAEMLIWGGLGGGTTGGQYDAMTDSWLPTSTTGAPSPPGLPRMIWTGNLAIVWGGVGGLYDPVNDIWLATSAANSPSPRDNESVVWTGSQMIVWGGMAGWSDVNDGGLYCPCPAILYYHDGDGDLFGEPSATAQICVAPVGHVARGGDCDDADSSVWATPTETLYLRFENQDSIVWDPPSAPGGVMTAYDLLRSENPAEFLTDTSCVESNLPTPSAADWDIPEIGRAYYYLVRAENACPNGTGSLGSSSSGTERQGRLCP